MPQSINLLTVIGHDRATFELGYCTQPSRGDKPNQKYYDDWELLTATPALRDKGYKVLGWRNGEVDSFGPLSRYVVVIAPNGERQELWYG